jgi:hypothetical protein
MPDGADDHADLVVVQDQVTDLAIGSIAVE